MCTCKDIGAYTKHEVSMFNPLAKRHRHLNNADTNG